MTHYLKVLRAMDRLRTSCTEQDDSDLVTVNRADLEIVIEAAGKAKLSLREGRRKLAIHGYRVAKLNSGLGPGNGWVLEDPDGAHLMIGESGGVAESESEVINEGLARIEYDERIAQALLERTSR